MSSLETELLPEVKVDHRLDEVSKVIQENGWCRATQVKIAEQYGVTTRTVRNWVAEIAKELRESREEVDWAARKDFFIEQLQYQIQKFMQAKAYSAVTASMGLLAKIEGFDRAQEEDNESKRDDGNLADAAESVLDKLKNAPPRGPEESPEGEV